MAATKVDVITKKGKTASFALTVWNRLKKEKDGSANGWYPVTNKDNPILSIPGAEMEGVKIPQELKVIKKGDAASVANGKPVEVITEAVVNERITKAVEETSKKIHDHYEALAKVEAEKKANDPIALRMNSLTEFLIDKDLLTEEGQNPVEVVINQIEEKIAADKDKKDLTNAETQLKEIADHLKSKGTEIGSEENVAQVTVNLLSTIKIPKTSKQDADKK